MNAHFRLFKQVFPYPGTKDSFFFFKETCGYSTISLETDNFVFKFYVCQTVAIDTSMNINSRL